MGWLGVTIPEEQGGSAFGVGSAVCIAEMMGRYLLSTPFFSSTLAAQMLLRAGTPEQQNNWLPAIAEGRIGTLALLENEDWGEDQLQCTAEAVNGELVLSGAKTLVTDAGVADIFLVSLRYQSHTRLALVEAGQLPDGAINHQTLLDETKRAAKVSFSGVRIAEDALLDQSRTESALHDVRLLGALLSAAEAAGSAAAALNLTVEYLKTRKQFGRLIGSYQALKHPAVDILCAVDSSKSLIYHAATVVSDEPLNRDAEIACRMAKSQASTTLLMAGDRAIQFHGGMGFTYECDAQLYMRRALWLQQYFGDPLHHRKRLAPLLLD